jgi:hypothetical protein
MELKWQLAPMMGLSSFGVIQGKANKYFKEKDDQISL